MSVDMCMQCVWYRILSSECSQLLLLAYSRNMMVLYITDSNKLCGLQCGQHDMPPSLASGDLKSHPGLSA